MTIFSFKLCQKQIQREYQESNMLKDGHKHWEKTILYISQESIKKGFAS